ncbi:MULTISPECIES: site-2 protease family protein [Bhargavaea]|uniref:Site-2 protease family protein n=1 Tax=Bhargavaea changchunensis TaxID=2134037 RepID=A0ABW2NG60_9BACL|nr:site-2 protease family protein [Bhargavaea sp. CC-171006]
MKYRMHPVMIPFLLAIIASGNVSFYAIVLSSLLFHEAGHLLAAKWTGAPVRQCVIMPYGGEIVIPRFSRLPKTDRLLIVAGGPAATTLLLAVSLFIQIPGRDQLITTQLALLGLNLLPFLPLDGGRAALVFFPDQKIALILLSIFVSVAAAVFLILYLPQSAPYLFLALFLLLQNILHWRYRKYERVLERVYAGSFPKPAVDRKSGL